MYFVFLSSLPPPLPMVGTLEYSLNLNSRHFYLLQGKQTIGQSLTDHPLLCRMHFLILWEFQRLLRYPSGPQGVHLQMRDDTFSSITKKRKGSEDHKETAVKFLRHPNLMEGTKEALGSFKLEQDFSTFNILVRYFLLSKGGLGTWSQAVAARGDGRPCVSPGLQPSQNAKNLPVLKCWLNLKGNCAGQTK